MRRSIFPLRLVAAVILGLVVCDLAARAEDTPVITVSKGAGQIGLALNPLAGPDGAAATKTLTDDLNMAGAFALTVGPGASTYTARGTADGSGLAGKLVDRGGNTLVDKTYPGPARAAAHAFADDIVLALTHARGIAGGKIAFIATRSGAKEVYVCNTDGSDLRQLTSDHSISVGPALSPDGRRLAYTGYKSGYADVYVVNLASGTRDRVVKFPGTNTGAAFSPDGGRLALSCSRDGNPELYTTDVSGGGARRLTHTPAVESSPTWSPDGSEIIYVVSDAGSAPQLYRIGADGGTGRHVSTGFGFCTEPNWSPDGKRLAFNVREGGGFAVAVMDLGGGSAHVVATDAERPAWGADSRHLIYSDGGAVVILDVPTGKKTRVASGLGKVSEPTWSR